MSPPTATATRSRRAAAPKAADSPGFGFDFEPLDIFAEDQQPATPDALVGTDREARCHAVGSDSLDDEPDLKGPRHRQAAEGCATIGCEYNVHARCFRRRTVDVCRRAFSEKTLREVLGGPLEEGCSYHVISGGDIDLLSYLAVLLEEQPLDFALASTWCIGRDDVLALREHLVSRRIQRLDVYMGEIARASYSTEFALLSEVIREHSPGGRLGVFRNHAKIVLGCGPKYAFTVESSANANTNPRSEQSTVIVGEDLFRFYLDFYNGIVSFDRSFDNWAPWTPERRNAA